MISKICNRCEKRKVISRFHRRRNGKLETYCRKCRNIVARRYWETNRKVLLAYYRAYYKLKRDVIRRRRRALANKHPIKHRRSTRRRHVRYQYGITLEFLRKMLHDQNSRCAICLRRNTWRALCVDHDHKTNRIRGLLCHRCNRGVGIFRDDIEEFRRAVSYLRRHNDKKS